MVLWRHSERGEPVVTLWSVKMLKVNRNAACGGAQS
jgi:hypothetical protein